MQRKREREKQRFAELEADVTGRGAQTVRGAMPACRAAHRWCPFIVQPCSLSVCSWQL
jgi:hypothetical protein